MSAPPSNIDWAMTRPEATSTSDQSSNAREADAADLPEPVRQLMKLTARVMTSTAYRV